MNRRTFLGNSLASAAALSIPNIRTMAAPIAANDRISMAYIGVGGYGANGVRSNSSEHRCAFCDVDNAFASKIYDKYSKVPRFRDFRKMFDALGSKIDAVSISTPDHTHFPIAMEAMQRGYHVYLEKPMAHNISQIRTLRAAARKYDVKTQLGTQGRSGEGIRLIKEWLESGVIGQVKDVYFWTNRPLERDLHKYEADAPGQAVPNTLDWDLFLGPARERPYNKIYTPTSWRGWWDFGNGPLGDIGAHMWDVAEYCLEIGLPKTVSAQHDRDSEFGTPPWIQVDYLYESKVQESPVTIHWNSGSRNGKTNFPSGLPYWPDDVKKKDVAGMYFVGEHGGIYVPFMRVEMRPSIFPEKLWKDFRQNLPDKKIQRIKGGHYKEFFNALREGRQPNAAFEKSSVLSESLLVGNLAVRTGKTIHWDAENAKAIGVPEADRYIQGPTPREGWKYTL